MRVQICLFWRRVGKGKEKKNLNLLLLQGRGGTSWLRLVVGLGSRQGELSPAEVVVLESLHRVLCSYCKALLMVCGNTRQMLIY